MGDDYVPSKRQTFLYFAYGSNLWTNRIRIQNKSAVRSGIAELKVNIIFALLTISIPSDNHTEMVNISFAGISNFPRATAWISISRKIESPIGTAAPQR